MPKVWIVVIGMTCHGSCVDSVHATHTSASTRAEEIRRTADKSQPKNSPWIWRSTGADEWRSHCDWMTVREWEVQGSVDAG